MSQPHSSLRLSAFDHPDHLCNGLCPDEPGEGSPGPDSRDPSCFYCQVLSLEEQFEAARSELNKQTVSMSAALTREVTTRRKLEEQCEAYRSALEEVHDQLCGCDRPANPAACIAPEETWGAFALLKESIPTREYVEDMRGDMHPVAPRSNPAKGSE